MDRSDAIATVWHHIEPYLFLEDSISVAKTCKVLDETIIDTASREVKVSNFTCMDVQKDQYRLALPWALNCVHFPSIRRLHFPPTIIEHVHLTGFQRYLFPGTSSDEYDLVETILSCFPMLAMNLGQALNLEHFTIDLGRIVQTLYDGQARGESLKFILDILVRNLRNCRAMKGLNIINCGWTITDNDNFDYGVYHSATLIRELDPVIQMKRNELEELSIRVGGTPTDSHWSGGYIHNALFATVMSMTKLKKLWIVIWNSSDAALSVLRGVDYQSDRVKNNKWPELQSLALHFDMPEPEDPGNNIIIMCSAVPLMMHFANCHSLCEVRLRIPRFLWKEKASQDAFVKLLHFSPKLNWLGIHFDCFCDRDGALLQILLDFIKDRSINNNNIDCFRIDCLKETRTLGLRKLVQFLEGMGMYVDHERCLDTENHSKVVDFRTSAEQIIVVQCICLLRPGCAEK